MIQALVTSWPMWAALGAAGLAGVGLLAWGAAHPRSSLLTPVRWRGPRDGRSGSHSHRGAGEDPGASESRDRPRLALTFDDGPDPAATAAIADQLDQRGVRASFFVIGVHARAHPEVLRSLHEHGHVIANHTDTHGWMGMCHGLVYWRRELTACSDAIERAIGVRPALFRPPMGFKQRLIGWAAQRQGLTLVTWSRRGRDGWPTSTEAILDRLAQRARAGDILTLHDGHDPHLPDRDPAATVAAVGPLVDALLGRGFELVTVDELLGLPAYQPPPPPEVSASREGLPPAP